MHRLLFIVTVLLAGLAAGCASTKDIKINQAETHYIMGVSYLQERDSTRALNEFRKAMELTPDDARIQAALAQSYQLRRALPEAERHYLLALKLGGPDPQIQNNLGSLYLDMQRWDDAIRQFKPAADNLVFTEQALAMTGLGLAHARKGETLEAVSAYQRALRENPDFVQALFLLGEVYDQMGKPDLAVEAYRKTLNLVPRDPSVHLQLALVYIKLGEHEKSAASLREVLRLAPDSEQGTKAAEYLKLL